MTLQIRDRALNPEAGTTEGPGINYKGLMPDERQRVMPHAQAVPTRASHHLGGGLAIIRALAKAVIAAAGKWWRAYNIRRAHIAAVGELHALDDRTLGGHWGEPLGDRMGGGSTAEMRRLVRA